MKIELIKNIKINGIEKKAGLVMDVDLSRGKELIKKKKAKKYSSEPEVIIPVEEKVEENNDKNEKIN